MISSYEETHLSFTRSRKESICDVCLLSSSMLQIASASAVAAADLSYGLKGLSSRHISSEPGVPWGSFLPFVDMSRRVEYKAAHNVWSNTLPPIGRQCAGMLSFNAKAARKTGVEAVTYNSAKQPIARDMA